ncbi:hypothetical protein BWQ93_03200 [Sphingopyxis sp. QXT-31]|nr:hypothetical protein BWQ93_03200 [Sphingopyxis sp. QXT-31]
MIVVDDQFDHTILISMLIDQLARRVVSTRLAMIIARRRTFGKSRPPAIDQMISARIAVQQILNAFGTVRRLAQSKSLCIWHIGYLIANGGP